MKESFRERNNIHVEEIVEEKPVTIIGKVVNCKYLNIRSTPSTKAEISGLLSEGDKVELIEGANEKFYRTTVGYVMKDYIEIV